MLAGSGIVERPVGRSTPRVHRRRPVQAVWIVHPGDQPVRRRGQARDPIVRHAGHGVACEKRRGSPCFGHNRPSCISRRHTALSLRGVQRTPSPTPAFTGLKHHGDAALAAPVPTDADDPARRRFDGRDFARLPSVAFNAEALSLARLCGRPYPRLSRSSARDDSVVSDPPRAATRHRRRRTPLEFCATVFAAARCSRGRLDGTAIETSRDASPRRATGVRRRLCVTAFAYPALRVVTTHSRGPALAIRDVVRVEPIARSPVRLPFETRTLGSGSWPASEEAAGSDACRRVSHLSKSQPQPEPPKAPRWAHTANRPFV